MVLEMVFLEIGYVSTVGYGVVDFWGNLVYFFGVKSLNQGLNVLVSLVKQVGFPRLGQCYWLGLQSK